LADHKHRPIFLAFDDWKGRYLFSNKNTASADVMILFNTNFEYKLENVVTDSDERELLNAILFRH
jgi:hypothetical protein